MTTKTHITPEDLRTLSDVANAFSWSADLRKQHPAINAAFYRFIEAYKADLEKIAQNWGTSEF